MATPSRTVLWVFIAVAIALLVAPLVGMFGMGAAMMGGGWMFGMHLTGLLWLVALIFVIAALVVLLARGEVG
jgi:hypothetical protein